MFKTNSLLSQKLLGIALALSCFTTACGGEQKQAAVPKAIPVKLQTLATATVIDSSNYVGTLEASQRVQLAPSRTSGTIVNIFVQEGQSVRKGQKLIELLPTQEEEDVRAATGNLDIAKANLVAAGAEVRQRQAERDTAAADVERARADLAKAEAEVKAAQAEVSDAEANLVLAEINYKRSEFLVGQDVRAKQDLDDKTRELDTAKAQLNNKKARVAAAIKAADAFKESLNAQIQNLRAAEKRIEGARANVEAQKGGITQAEGQLGSTGQQLEFNFLFAPIDGIVGDFNERKVGDQVGTGEIITTITDNKVFLLNVNIPTEYRSKLREGLPVEIINPDGTIGVRGTVSYIAPLVNQNNQSILTKMTFRNDGSLRDEQYVTVRVIWDRKPGVLVPTTAVTSLGAQKFVFVAESSAGKDGKQTLIAKQQAITVGEIQGQSYPVIAGLKAGDRIAVDRILDLKDGTPITEESLQKVVEQ